MRAIGQADAPALLSELNTTPLIDVMLVLLVMFIITLPMQTHSVKFDLPGILRSPLPVLQANLLTIDAAGALQWNGTAIDRSVLRQELAAMHETMPAPELHLQPAPDARHGEVDELLAMIKREQISRFGFVGNEAYQNLF